MAAVALWVLASMFAFMAAIFTLVWRLRRRHHLEQTASFVSVQGVVVDRVEREVISPRGGRVSRVTVTVEYRDHRQTVHRLTADEGSFYRFIGDPTTVYYDRLAPVDARLEPHRRVDLLFLALGLLFGGLTTLLATLALAAS